VSAPTIFTVASFGRSGTVWLSKVLNSNPDVMAYHEGVMKHVYPRMWTEAGMTETENWFGVMKTMSPWDVGWSTYKALGDVNSFFGFDRVEPWGNEFYRAAMRPRHDKIIEGTRLSFLTRNPILMVESKWRLLKSIWDFYRDYGLWYGREMIELNRDGLEEFEAEIERSLEARIFFMLCLHLRCTVRFGYPRTYRLEDLSGSVEATTKACEEITGIPFDPKQVETVHAHKVNVQPGAAQYERNDRRIWEQWPPVFQKMFARLCGDLPGRLGYAPVAPTDQLLEKVIGLDTPEAPDYVPRHYPSADAQQDYEFARRLRDRGFSPESTVDVGGSDGSWSRRIVELFPKSRLTVFEPLADHAAKFRKGLEAITATSPNVSVLKHALGDSVARVPLFVHAWPEASSCLPSAEGGKNSGFELVTMLTLDVAVRKFQIPPPALLKINVNGFELQVLKGAKETLATVEVLFLEVWLLRDGGPGNALLPEVVNWLGSRGLYLAEWLEARRNEEGLRVSQRVVFMRESNPYFRSFGPRQFQLEMPAGFPKTA
jgi:FkbM family methyltransferase